MARVVKKINNQKRYILMINKWLIIINISIQIKKEFKTTYNFSIITTMANKSKMIIISKTTTICLYKLVLSLKRAKLNNKYSSYRI